jgi:hypothetical protein
MGGLAYGIPMKLSTVLFDEPMRVPFFIVTEGLVVRISALARPEAAIARRARSERMVAVSMLADVER